MAASAIERWNERCRGRGGSNVFLSHSKVK